MLVTEFSHTRPWASIPPLLLASNLVGCFLKWTMARDVFGFLPESVGRPAVCCGLDERPFDGYRWPCMEREEDEVTLHCHTIFIMHDVMVTWLHLVVG